MSRTTPTVLTSAALIVCGAMAGTAAADDEHLFVHSGRVAPIPSVAGGFFDADAFFDFDDLDVRDDLDEIVRTLAWDPRYASRLGRAILVRGGPGPAPAAYLPREVPLAVALEPYGTGPLADRPDEPVLDEDVAIVGGTISGWTEAPGVHAPGNRAVYRLTLRGGGSWLVAPGPGTDLRALDPRPGRRIIVSGEESTVGDATVVLADAIEVSDRE